MKSKPIGSLWKKQDKNGNDYFSGVIDLSIFGQVKVTVFPNGKKEKDTHPDYIINLATPQKDNDFPKE